MCACCGGNLTRSRQDFQVKAHMGGYFMARARLHGRHEFVTKRRLLGSVTATVLLAALGVAATAPAAQAAPGDASIVIQVGGVRDISVPGGNLTKIASDVLPLGAEFVLYPMTLSTGYLPGPTAIDFGWARSSAVDASGTVTFTIPVVESAELTAPASTVGGQYGAEGAVTGTQFFIKIDPATVPSGWYGDLTFRTGTGTQNDADMPYGFPSAPLAADIEQRSGIDFMKPNQVDGNGLFFAGGYGGYNAAGFGGIEGGGTDSTRRTASSGIWPVSLADPPLPPQCGIDVALVVDLSGSIATLPEIGGTNGLQQLQAAANGIVDTLLGTGSRMATFTFNDDSPASGGSNKPGLVSLATQADAQAVRDEIATWTAIGGTNWDRAFEQVATANAGADRYDVVIFVTDGNPTVVRTNPTIPAGDRISNDFRTDEEAVFSANAVKAQGSHILAVGVGADIVNPASSAERNFQAISGPERVHDNFDNLSTGSYILSQDFTGLTEAVDQIVLTGCGDSTTPPTTPPTTNPPPTTVTPRPPLAATGADASATATLAAAIVALGVALVLGSRRRPDGRHVR
jgi:hypothetical protein